MTIELRRVSDDDWRTWRAVRLAALTDAPAAFASRRHEWADASEARWRGRLSIPGAMDLVAVDLDRNAPVGMVTGTPATDRSGSAELISLWVDPASRHRGVAALLITAIARWSADTGATSLVHSVMPENVGARRTYERNGFTVPGPAAHGVCDAAGQLPGDDRELVMLRDLSTERLEGTERTDGIEERG